MNTEHANATQPNQGRDQRGRFAPGNPGGPGNPFTRQVASLRKALIDSVTPQDIQDVAAKLIAMAKDGNVQAAKLLLTYVIGKPQPAPEPDRMDAHEWAVYQETAPMKEESAAVINALEPAFHLATVRATRPIVTGLVRDKVVNMFLEDPAERKKREDAQAEEDERFINQQVEVPEWFDAYGPSANGDDGESEPSVNGGDGGPRPSANGKKRPAPAGGDRFQPSTNGDLRP